MGYKNVPAVLSVISGAGQAGRQAREREKEKEKERERAAAAFTPTGCLESLSVRTSPENPGPHPTPPALPACLPADGGGSL